MKKCLFCTDDAKKETRRYQNFELVIKNLKLKQAVTGNLLFLQIKFSWNL